ncbi:nonsense-mediated mRNA decay factor SMG5-like isoform X2 [Sorex araneus]|nr:nonsense-mediated mRNA decay factor SMG5-like isoform X2 [Sorex araneus]XP_054982673.1 nonsense-mediated mRNA decay factor SMG5-like isoform X2 [Sorex araneus]XP_054982674.1 nonsense-mediated mRNA decay factor SMG5-like isoform X2 [Sorex araneus]XP_054982675.1 nonsense-mediated mRNA decay factor SMG5-like isoform X2 [Sorex araneus]XP_054982676.1 nonsense-mediated mRNA decay factor SMG5-like isoform X2 [Sorex araneus]
MEKDSTPMDRSQAEAQKARLLYRDVCLAAQRLDFFLRKGNAHKEVFKPHVLALRDTVRQVCIKLMFLHPVDYGRKAEELLWRKLYADVALLLLKTKRKHLGTSPPWEGPLRAHLNGGLTFYEHLFLFLQNHYGLRLQSCIDWPHRAIHLIGCKKLGPPSEEEALWARMACHRCLLYLGDLFRYQNEFLALATTDLAEKCYYRALSVAPHMGMPFNQLGALVGSKYYDVEATYFYQRCLHSEVPFKGAAWNLKRLYDQARKRYSRLKRYQGQKLSPRQRQCWDNKRLLVSFLYLQSLLQPQRKFRATSLMALCQLVLDDFRLCLFYRPCPSDLNQTSAERKPSRGYLFLPDLLIFHMVVLCLMSIHSLRKTGSKRHRPAVFFTLTLFSHVIQHVNARIQAELQKGRLSDTRQEQETELGSQVTPSSCTKVPLSKSQSSDSCEGYTSEVGFGSCCDSDEDEDRSLSSHASSETSSETSYSDTIDEAESGAPNLEAVQESGGNKSQSRDTRPQGQLKACGPPAHLLDFLKTTLFANLPTPLSQKLQGKHDLPSAPAFRGGLHMLLSELSPTLGGASGREDTASHLPEAESSPVSSLWQDAITPQPCLPPQPLRQKLQILSAEGLLPTVKVMLSWLRTNHSLLSSCWRGPLSLWDHLSVLLNLLPSARDLQAPGLGLSPHLRELLQTCHGPSVPRLPQLPEDLAWCRPPLVPSSRERAAVEQDLLPLSPQDEAAVRICFLRSFGHFAATLPGGFLRFDLKSGVFVSTAPSGAESCSQNFLERMPRVRFSKDMVQLWLQREVLHLETTLWGLQVQSALTPYLFPDPRALFEHLPRIQHLATSGKFFLIIPKIVVDILYVLRKEDPRALAAITFLEDELKKGNPSILCQSFMAKKFVRPRMTIPDSDAWDLYNVLDFCKGLLNSSRLHTGTPSSMVTIITGICLDNPRNFSYPLQLALGTAAEAGVEIKNVRRFHREWTAVG